MLTLTLICVGVDPCAHWRASVSDTPQHSSKEGVVLHAISASSIAAIFPISHDLLIEEVGRNSYLGVFGVVERQAFERD